MALAQLPADPRDAELEDFVAAHFAARGAYVETGITERHPTDILELDVVWTEYRNDPPASQPVEVKSGKDIGLGDVFKFYGWTKYLGLPPGMFIHREPFGSADEDCLKHISTGTGIDLVRVEKLTDIEVVLDKHKLPKPAATYLADLWRFSFWAQRRLLAAVRQAKKQNICPQTMEAARRYQLLINDAVFFIPDVRDRVGKLLEAHLGHQRLAATAGLELEGGKVDFNEPTETQAFKAALYNGKHYPIQACMYLAHRARLYVLKAAVDYWIKRERGEIPTSIIRIGEVEIDLEAAGLHSAFLRGSTRLAKAKSFRRFPVFWQTFLWSWGGFLLTDRLEKERALLAEETGVPVDEIDVALSAFDELFPVGARGWFRESWTDKRRVIMQTPAAMRGIGAHRRKLMYGAKSVVDLGYKDYTTNDLARDIKCVAELLESKDVDLVK